MSEDAGYVVVLDSGLSDDDAEATLAAIRRIKGVVGVAPIADTVEQQIATERVRHELSCKLWDVLYGKN